MLSGGLPYHKVLWNLTSLKKIWALVSLTWESIVIYLKLSREEPLCKAEQIHKVTTIITQNDNFVHLGQLWVFFLEFAQLYIKVILFSAWDKSRYPGATWIKLKHIKTPKNCSQLIRSAICFQRVEFLFPTLRAFWFLGKKCVTQKSH